MTPEQKQRLRSRIRKLILQEITTTGDIAGYQTPYAFTDVEDDEEDPYEKIKKKLSDEFQEYFEKTGHEFAD